MPEVDLTQPNPENQAGLENPGAGGAAPVVEPTIDWEAEGNPYKKRYADSQSQITPLVGTLSEFATYNHQNKTWEGKQAAAPAVPVVEEGVPFANYDPDFRKEIVNYTQKEIKAGIDNYRQNSAATTKYNSSVEASRSKALSEFGSDFELAKDGKFNTESPLYKIANEILANEYAEFNPDGSFNKYTTPDAEYIATVRAYGVISKQANKPAPNTQPLTAMQGAGSKAGGVKRGLSYAEYDALSEDDKNAYDLQQMS